MAESDHMLKKSSTIQNISFNIVHLVIISKIIYILLFVHNHQQKYFLQLEHHIAGLVHL